MESKSKTTCPFCGAKLFYEGAVAEVYCNYCGVQVALTDAVQVSDTMAIDMQKWARDAISFSKSLEVSVDGNKYALTDLWHSLVSNKSVTKDKLTQFYKNFKKQIVFCIGVYELLSQETKYELGEFVCAQMKEIIKFRDENSFIYLEELDEIATYRTKLEYDFKGTGLFNIKAKLLIHKKLNRIKARKAILEYDYAIKQMAKIQEKYNAKIEPIKQTYQETAKTAFSRRKDLKMQMDNLEQQKQVEIRRLGIDVLTKEYKKVVRKYKIKHKDWIEEKMSAQQKGEEVFLTTDVLKTNGPNKTETKNSYADMSVMQLIDALAMAVDKLKAGVTMGEINRCKEAVMELAKKKVEAPADAGVYIDAVVMQVNMVVDKKQPVMIKAVLDSVYDNIKMQINNVKMQISK